MDAASLIPRLRRLPSLITHNAINEALTEVRALLQPGTGAIFETNTANSFVRNILIRFQGILVQLELLKNALEVDSSVRAGDFRLTSRHRRNCIKKTQEWARNAIAVVKRQVQLDNSECVCLMPSVNSFGGAD